MWTALLLQPCAKQNAFHSFKVGDITTLLPEKLPHENQQSRVIGSHKQMVVAGVSLAGKVVVCEPPCFQIQSVPPEVLECRSSRGAARARAMTNGCTSRKEPWGRTLGSVLHCCVLMRLGSARRSCFMSKLQTL
eukprot:1599675-Pleurochrysis_carterae.AAC.2